MRKPNLIREFTEFNLNRMNADQTPMSVHTDNPEFTQDAFDRHIDQLRDSNIALNNILKQVGSNKLYKIGGGTINGLDIKNLKIIRIFKKDEIDIKVCLSFELDESEYYATIDDFMTSPVFKSEILSDRDINLTKEWLLKIKGLLIKVIKQWMYIKRGNYVALKDIDCFNYDTGEIINIKKDSSIKVYRTIEEGVVCEYNGVKCKITGMNYYYFNYFFEKK